MPSSTYIRLAGPLQSWAGLAVSGNFVRTEPRPTLSALRGLLAASLGAKRGQWPTWIDDVHFTLREDKTPKYVDDFHTIGDREDEFTFRRRLAIMQQMKATSVKQLKFTPAVGATSISRRTYLAESEFIVRATLEGHTEEIDQSFASPVFSVYLGRKAFPATFPFYLGTGPAEMLSLIPALAPNASSKATVRIFEPSLGSGVSPESMSVPAVATRTDWLKGIKELSLHRHSTIQR
ncbi:MAG: type I-E CRISPR-associated protein Cas5/CasD [Corynebacterium striatum]|uniref:type I-E CRISPR-associated protein Cas5/CasD n=1 Tax=Corynebacterium sp. c25Ua_89 TaxID=3032356 RepID=UPI0029025669|nr:type I-E CRISPR-associated protein Cas5/CasD [Corynebacterium striatum]